MNDKQLMVIARIEAIAIALYTQPGDTNTWDQCLFLAIDMIHDSVHSAVTNELACWQ